MYQKNIILFFWIIASFVNIEAATYPYYQPISLNLVDSATPQCYNEICPSRTSGCKKLVKTSADKQNLVTTISCLDAQDMVLKDYIKPEANPYGPYTHYESTSFSGTYSSSGYANPVNVNINNNVGPLVEDFS